MGRVGVAEEEGVEDKHIVRSEHGGMDGEKAKGVGGRASNYPQKFDIPSKSTQPSDMAN